VLRTEQRDDPPARVGVEEVDRGPELGVDPRRVCEQADPPPGDERIAIAEQDLETAVHIGRAPSVDRGVPNTPTRPGSDQACLRHAVTTA